MKRSLKRRGVILALLLCALPAHSADPTQLEMHALTPIDALPTKDEIIKLTGPNAIPRLRELALAQTVDFGVQLRAIRALPHFCTPTCKVTGPVPPHPAHDAILEVITSVPDNDRSGRAILRLRAALEALGLVRSGAQGDLTLLVKFLNDESRDIRAAAARAIRDSCQQAAEDALRARYQIDQVAQVRLAISTTLDDLISCSPP